MIVFRNHYVCGPHPQHLLTGIDWENFELPSSFGGVVSFPPEAVVRVNGFSNLYWGWGREDDELGDRIIAENMAYVRAVPPNTGYYFTTT